MMPTMSPTTTLAPTTMVSTDPSTTVSTDDNQNSENGSGELPAQPVIDHADCSCTLASSNPPDILATIPQEICPFIAPVYHHLFGCSAECPPYDLHLDLNTGTLKRVLFESSALEEAIDSCSIGRYTIVSNLNSQRTGAISSETQDPIINTVAVSEDIRAPLEDSLACQGVPHFLHPALHCPKSDSFSQGNCPPVKIILKTLEHNLTYTLESSSDSSADEINLKGQYYSLSRSRKLNVNKRDSDFRETNEEFQFSYIKCDLEASFPEVLRDIPKEVCPFIAPSLHKLFNCSMNTECEQFVAVVDQEDHNIKEIKVPVSQLQQQAQNCPKCQQQLLDLNSINPEISAIIQVLTDIISDSGFICKLLPFDWISLIFGCSTLGVVQNTSENECPPVSVIVQSSHATFTYTSEFQNHSQPTIHWQGSTFALESIDMDKSPAEVLQDKYGIDVNSHLRKMTSEKTVDRINSQSRNKLLGQTQAWRRAQANTTGEVVNGTTKTLQDYTGQNDVFLPLNAPEVSYAHNCA